MQWRWWKKLVAVAVGVVAIFQLFDWVRSAVLAMGEELVVRVEYGKAEFPASLPGSPGELARELDTEGLKELIGLADLEVSERLRVDDILAKLREKVPVAVESGENNKEKMAWLEELRSEIVGLGRRQRETMVDLLRWGLVERIGTSQRKLSRLQSLWTATVRNEGRSELKGVWLTLPEAEWVRIRRKGVEERNEDVDEVVEIGGLRVGEEVAVSGWSSGLVVAYNARGVEAGHVGGRGKVRVLVPVGWLGQVVEEWAFPLCVGLAVGGALFLLFGAAELVGSRSKDEKEERGAVAEAESESEGRGTVGDEGENGVS